LENLHTTIPVWKYYKIVYSKNNHKKCLYFHEKPPFFDDFDTKLGPFYDIKKVPFLHRPRNAIFARSRTHLKSIYQNIRLDFCRKFAGFAGFYKPSNAIKSSRIHDKIK